MRLRVRLRLSTVAATAAVALFGPAVVRADAPGFTVSGATSTLQASSMLVSQFSYVGTSAFTDGSGNSVTALEFTLTSATAITALKSFVPCHDVGDGMQLIYVVEADSASATGGLVLFASDVAYTDGGGAHAWTVANPPSAPGVLDDGVTITGIVMTVVGQSIPSLSLTGQRVYAAFCGSTSGSVTKPLPAPNPTAATSPSSAPFIAPSPTAAPSSQPAPTPSPSPQQTVVPSPSPVTTPLPAFSP